jgi:hypothetical protein
MKAAQNGATPRHFADMAWSPCRELGYRSAIPAPGLRGPLFGVSFLMDELSKHGVIELMGNQFRLYRVEGVPGRPVRELRPEGMPRPAAALA